MAGSSKPTRRVGREQVEEFVEDLFGEAIHAKRVESIINGVDGVLHAASLGVRAIGHGLAAAQGLAPKHAIQQVDRLLSNAKLGMESLFHGWVPFVLGQRTEIFVNFDWTEFEASDQSLLVLRMQTDHGRSTPLVWKCVTRSELKDRRNDHEDEPLALFARVVPEHVGVTVVADRGFADSKLYHLLSEELAFDYLIRFRGVIHVEARDAERSARRRSGWARADGCGCCCRRGGRPNVIRCR